MKNYIKSIASVALLATMASTSHAAKSVTIGELQNFVGPLESMIGEMTGAVHLAVDEANASGAYLQGTINVVTADSTCADPAIAIAEAEKMLNEHNVIGIMGPNCSAITTAVINAVIAPNGVVSISPSATSPAIDALDDGGFFFRTAPPDTKQGPALSKIAMSRGQTDMAVTYVNNDYGKALADAFVTAYEADGGTVTVFAAREDDKADYSADVAALSAGGSATLAVFGYADTGGRGILTASGDTGAFTDYVFGDGMISQVTADLAGDGSWGTQPSASEELQAAWNIVAEAAGLTGTAVFSGQSYDAMALIILASQAAGSTDRAAIAAEVLNVANAPGNKCAAGDLGTCLKYISGGLPVDYVGATGVELDASGTPNGSYSEQEIVAGAFTSLRVH
jgi:branched-chain amino acid transport system substrate-binding protein